MNIAGSLSRKDLYEVSREFKIAFIAPIAFSESKTYHLLVIT